MRKDFEDYKVDGKHFKLRVVLFFITLVIAITAIAFGISKLISKEEGYYDIAEYPSEDAPIYGQDFELHYYLTGSSSNIKEQNKLIEGIYSTSLERAYKLLDSENEYEGYKNIAYINNHPDETVSVNDELLWVLKDAYAKTCKEEGYNMFAGALYDHWNSILVLDNENEFDPVNNEEEKERIEAMAELCANLGMFDLSFDGNNVKFKVSKEYTDALVENEESGKLIDLNLLKDSYITKIVADSLEKEGYSNGYILSESGIVYNLSSHGNGTYVFYSVDRICDGEDGEEAYPEVSMLEGEKVTQGSCASGFRLFALKRNEFMYHIVNNAGEYIMRSPVVNVNGAGSYNIYDSVYAVSESGDIVGATYENIKVINSDCIVEEKPATKNEIGIYLFRR